MGTLYLRLLEICKDQGIAAPKKADIARLVGFSKGRPTQIEQEGGAARLGEKYLPVLTRLGYSVDWIQEGRGNKFAGTRAAPVVAIERPSFQNKHIAAVVWFMEDMDDEGRAECVGVVRQFASTLAKSKGGKQKSSA